MHEERRRLGTGRRGGREVKIKGPSKGCATKVWFALEKRGEKRTRKGVVA